MELFYETEKRSRMMPRVSADGKLVAFFDFDVEIGDYALCIAGTNADFVRNGSSHSTRTSC